MALYVYGNGKFAITDIGGFAIKLTNKTGAASVRGTLVESDTTTDSAFKNNAADGNHPIGIVFEDGIADAFECWVVISGICQVLLKNATASTRGFWVRGSTDTIGRADATLENPPGGGIVPLDAHMQEIGHCLETKGADTDVLCKIVLHFN